MSGEELYQLAEGLAKLAGMAYAQGKHTPEEWERITGTNPLTFPKGYIEIRSGACFWTRKAAELYEAYCNLRQHNWHAILYAEGG